MELHPSLRDNVRLLGEQLGQIMVTDRGDSFLERIERLRGLSKSVHQGDDGARDLLIQEVRNLGDEELVSVARAFTQFLNLANIAEQHHRVRKTRGDLKIAILTLMILRYRIYWIRSWSRINQTWY